MAEAGLTLSVLDSMVTWIFAAEVALKLVGEAFHIAFQKRLHRGIYRRCDTAFKLAALRQQPVAHGDMSSLASVIKHSLWRPGFHYIASIVASIFSLLLVRRALQRRSIPVRYCFCFGAVLTEARGFET